MVRISSVLILFGLISGCSTTSGTRQETVRSPDGTNLITQTLTIRNQRFFWASEGIDATVQDQHGFKFGLRVSKSNVDSAAITAVADGVVKAVQAGGVETMKPTKKVKSMSNQEQPQAVTDAGPNEMVISPEPPADASSIVYAACYSIPIRYGVAVPVNIRLGKGPRVKFQAPNRCLLFMGYDEEIVGEAKDCNFYFTRAPRVPTMPVVYPGLSNLAAHIGVITSQATGDVDCWSDCFKNA